MDSDERIFITNGSIFTKFNQKSKDELQIYKQTNLRKKIRNKDEQTGRHTNRYMKDGE
jgi:hypothetical protein